MELVQALPSHGAEFVARACEYHDGAGVASCRQVGPATRPARPRRSGQHEAARDHRPTGTPATRCGLGSSPLPLKLALRIVRSPDKLAMHLRNRVLMAPDVLEMHGVRNEKRPAPHEPLSAERFDNPHVHMTT